MILSIFYPLRSENSEVLHFFKRDQELAFYPNHIWRIESGLVKIISYSENTTPTVLGLWGKADFVGRFFGKVDSFQIICLSKVSASIVSFDDCQELPEIILDHLEQMQELELIRRYQKVDLMLVKLLTWLGQKFGQKTSQGILINLHFSHQDLADILGLKRIEITKSLNQLEQLGVIERLSLARIILKENNSWYYEI